MFQMLLNNSEDFKPDMDALIYLEKDIQLFTFLPTFVLCIIDKSHREFQELQKSPQNSKPY